jgi:formate hydrogenlyase subunit 4
MITVHRLIDVLLFLVLPPLLLGVVNKTKAAFGGRVGPPVLQVYYDLFKLFQKGSVFSVATTWVFRAGPVVGLAATLAAALFVPLSGPVAPLPFSGDVILFAYLLGLARFCTVLAALDTGSAFEGMGSAREATYACLAEPVLFFGLLVLTRLTRSLSLSGMLGGSLIADWETAGAAMLLVLASWFVLLLLENCRIPFDDPNTHLELTMIHEVMVLDHSGPGLGLIVYSAAVKLMVFATLIVRLAVPIDTGWGIVNGGLTVGALLVVAALVGVVESVMARLRLVSIPHLLAAAGVLSAFGLVLVVNQ